MGSDATHVSSSLCMGIAEVLTDLLRARAQEVTGVYTAEAPVHQPINRF